MKTSIKYSILIIVIILLIATFYSARSKQSALKIMNSTDWIARQHIEGQVKENDIGIFIRLPFGVLVSTYEGMWFITAWDKVL